MCPRTHLSFCAHVSTVPLWQSTGTQRVTATLYIGTPIAVCIAVDRKRETMTVEDEGDV